MIPSNTAAHIVRKAATPQPQVIPAGEATAIDIPAGTVEAIALHLARIAAFECAWPVGARVMVRIGHLHTEGVITARCKLGTDEIGAVVALDDHGDTVIVPLTDVQVIR